MTTPSWAAEGGPQHWVLHTGGGLTPGPETNAWRGCAGRELAQTGPGNLAVGAC
jgi:hypothetical protein